MAIERDMIAAGLLEDYFEDEGIYQTTLTLTKDGKYIKTEGRAVEYKEEEIKPEGEVNEPKPS